MNDVECQKKKYDKLKREWLNEIVYYNSPLTEYVKN